MPMPRLIVLTNAKPGEPDLEYLTDRDKFPAEELFTTDVGKARTWAYPPGVRRWVKRNIAVLPILKNCRRVWKGEDVIEAARKIGGHVVARTGKDTPNKRAKRVARKAGVSKHREVRKIGRRAATAKPPRTAKVA